MSLFARAAQNQNLAAWERGVYQFAQLLLGSLGPLSVLPFVADLLRSLNLWLTTGVWQSFDYLGDLRLLLAAILAAAWAAYQHYKNARHDAPLPSAMPAPISVAPSAPSYAPMTVAPSITIPMPSPPTGTVTWSSTTTSAPVLTPAPAPVADTPVQTMPVIASAPTSAT